MVWDSAAPLLLVTLAMLLVAAGIEDARQRTIGHGKTIAIVALAPLWWWANGLMPWPDMVLQFAVAAVLLALFCIPYALGGMAGGDVKLIAALALWLPVDVTFDMLTLMALAGGAVTLAFVIDRRVMRRSAAPEIPYGVAIAIAGLLVMREPIINQFG